MTTISWNEVRDRAVRFSREWAGATAEERDKQTFWNEFFEVFGVPRKSVATFEQAVAKAEGGHGFIDLFWRGVLLVEHKSAGHKLAKAESQAFDYIAELDATLADLYDPLSMPAALVKAHAALDRAVDRCYRREAFGSDRERVEYLFALYEKLAAPLLPAEGKGRRRGGRGAG